jgi:SAM-dependent methyltransferase
MVLTSRGMPLEHRRSWANKYASLAGKRLLLQGAGTGWEVPTWAVLRPKQIVALEMYSFASSWKEIRSQVQTASFVRGSLEDIPTRPGSFDMVASDAVFEHCRDLKAVAKEALRVLRPGGWLYATYGPLWYCWGGDHYSGRGGLQNGFNHVCLDSARYQDYFQSHLQFGEDAQSGGRYVTLDLFSKLRTEQYLDIYRSVGFQVRVLILELCERSLEFRGRWPERFKEVLEKNPGVTADDLLIKVNFVLLEKPQ